MLTREDIEAFMEEIDLSRKPPLSVAQMVDIFAETMRQEKDLSMSAELIREEFQEWDEESHYPNILLEKELKELADLVYVIYGYARARGWDLDEVIRRVHANNIQRCVWPDGGIRYREDGKVLKNPDAPAIDLSDLV